MSSTQPRSATFTEWWCVLIFSRGENKKGGGVSSSQRMKFIAVLQWACMFDAFGDILLTPQRVFTYLPDATKPSADVLYYAIG